MHRKRMARASLLVDERRLDQHALTAARRRRS